MLHCACCHLRITVLSCPDPGRPNNGDRDFVATSLGAVVNYTCNTGYSIRGAAQRTCQEDATGLSASWSQSLPSCQGMKRKEISLLPGGAKCTPRILHALFRVAKSRLSTETSVLPLLSTFGNS